MPHEPLVQLKVTAGIELLFIVVPIGAVGVGAAGAVGVQVGAQLLLHPLLSAGPPTHAFQHLHMPVLLLHVPQAHPPDLHHELHAESEQPPLQRFPGPPPPQSPGHELEVSPQLQEPSPQ